MKDIVDILRANSECHAPHLMLQAADEIELLRIGVTELRERNTKLLSKIQEYEAREQ